MDLLKWHKYNKEIIHKNEYELIPYLVDEKAPFVVVCPGGGYNMIASFIEGTPVAEHFQKKGVNAFVLRYRVKQKAHYPAPIEDIVHALTDIRDNYKLSLDNYALCGFSAGGHMCALFGTTDYGYAKYDLPKPSTLILVYPVISLEQEITHKNTRKWFAGNDEKALEIGNVYKHIDENYPRTFIWRGDNDRSVPPVNSDLLVEQLDKYHVEHEFYKYKKASHGTGLSENTDAKGWAEKAYKFWLGK